MANHIVIDVKWDDETSEYYAVCNEIGLGLESSSYDQLIQRVKDAVPELIELNNIKDCTSICFRTEERQVACA